MNTAVAAATLCVAASAVADVVRLTSGATVEGSVVKRNDRMIWVDVGSDILAFRLEDVEAVEIDASEVEIQTASESMYHTGTDLPELSPQEQAKRIGSAVIKVATPGGLGSGVIINGDGHAITNAHVIQGESNIRATVWRPKDDGTLQRETIEDVEIIAVNNHLDLALLRITSPDGKPFTYAPVQRAEQLEIGQTVFAIGNPLGLERTLSQGVISTTQRSFGGLTYIQTDAAINPGNSGGPLFNTKGEVVGITNMGILFAEGMGFAIPVRYVKDFIRNREAFVYDKDNPNSGHNYHDPPARREFGPPPHLLDGTSQRGPAADDAS
jgi:serine protease Do